MVIALSGILPVLKEKSYRLSLEIILDFASMRRCWPPESKQPVEKSNVLDKMRIGNPTSRVTKINRLEIVNSSLHIRVDFMEP
jgi:hypothetical protein